MRKKPEHKQHSTCGLYSIWVRMSALSNKPPCYSLILDDCKAADDSFDFPAAAVKDTKRKDLH